MEQQTLHHAPSVLLELRTQIDNVLQTLGTVQMELLIIQHVILAQAVKSYYEVNALHLFHQLDEHVILSVLVLALSELQQ